MAGIAHGGGLTAAIGRYGGTRGDWLDLSTGINPNMPDLPDIPTEVWNRLPDAGLVDEARAAARAFYLGHASNMPEQATTHGLPLAIPGTQSFIQILPRLVAEGRPVAIVAPTYGEYAHCFRAAGFAVDLIASPDDLRPDHAAFVVVNPNNPDGNTYQPDRLLALHQRLLAQGGHLHVDEAFGDGRPELTLAAQASALPCLTVSRSFGKFFGIAGLRLGFVFARPETLDRIEAALGPWAVSGPALFVASELMGRDRMAIASRIAARKQALDTVLTAAGLTIAGGTDLFSLVRLTAAPALFDHLAGCHILVRKFDYAPDWLRIGLTPDDKGDRRLAGALASFAA